MKWMIKTRSFFLISAFAPTSFPVLLLMMSITLFSASPLYAMTFATGETLMAKGDYQAAITLWDGLLKQQSPITYAKKLKILFQRGEAYRQLGLNKDALIDLKSAYQLAQKTENRQWQAIIAIELGRLYFQAQHLEKSEHYLQRALELAEQENHQDLSATAYHLLAHYTLQFDRSLAKSYYKKALAFAEQSGDKLLIAQIQVSLSILAFDTSDLAQSHKQTTPQRTSTSLRQAYKNIELLKPTMKSTHLKISIGYQAQSQGDFTLAYKALNQSMLDAQQIANDRLLSQAYGYLGRLYEQKKRFNDALTLTHSAILLAQGLSATDLLLQWEWQQGRLEKSLAHPMSSLAAYRRALQHLESVRMNIPINYQAGKSSFRTTLSPIYLQLTQLLLTQAKQFSEDSEKHQTYLSEAMAVIELLKTSELQDYFKDACTITQTQKLAFDDIEPGIAVVYPIIFSDHLDVLVQIGKIKRHKRFPVSSAHLSHIITRLEHSLRPSDGRLNQFASNESKILYDLLIKPWKKTFQENNIHTLVYAPDGALRKIPLGSLYSDQTFVIEQYAIAVIPGLSLMTAQTSERQNMQALVAGLSKPGDVVSQLPFSMIEGFIDPEVLSEHDSESPDTLIATRQLSFRSLPNLRNLPDTLQQSHKTLSTQTIAKRNIRLSFESKEKMQNSLELPGVVHEVQAIKKILPAEVLLNEHFLLDAFDEKITQNYRIVHIASHGFFSGTAQFSFIMTHDRLLDMNHLQDMFKSEAFSEAPVEILTLSACQTAEGDDRAPLGLSGIALKSGARTVIGSLWPVADEVAQTFLPDFYKNLLHKELSKAQALQKAQIKIIHEKKYIHPALWSAFILVGNW